MKLDVISGGVTAQGAHYSDRSVVEVPDDFFERVMAWVLESEKQGSAEIVISPENYAMFKTELKHG